MAGIGIEGGLLVVHGAYAAVGLPHLLHGTPNHQHTHCEEQYGAAGGNDYLALQVVEAEVFLELVLNGDEVLGLLHELVGCGRDGFDVLRHHEYAFESGFERIGLLAEDAERQPYYLLSVGGIDVGGYLMAELHVLEALAGHTVDAQNLHLALGLGLYDGLVGTRGHAVVVAEHYVGHLARAYLVAYYLAGFVGTPFAVAPDVFYICVSAHGFGKSLVALNGRRAALRACHLEHKKLPALGFTAHYVDDMIAYGVSGLEVVASNKGCVVARCGLAVEANHGYATGHDPVDGGRNGSAIVWSHHEQVDAGVCKAVNLPDLQLRVVAGAGYADRNRMVVEVLGGKHLAVDLVSPASAGALRNTNLVAFPVA